MALICFLANTSWADDFQLHRYTSSKVYNTNSYWLESDSGIALIDAQMLRSDAQLLAILIKSTGKPVKGAIITHPHFDHFGGLNLLRQEFGEFPIYTTEKTAAGFKPKHEESLSWLTDAYGDDYDPTLVEADTIVPSGTEIELAGIKLVIDDIGAGESDNSILIYQPDQNILFTGDATMHHGHFYTGEGHSEGAIKQHEYIKATYGTAKTLYAGHGDPATPGAILDAEIEYIKFVQAISKTALLEGNIKKADGSGFKDEIVQELVDQVATKYPHLNDFGLGVKTYIGWNIVGILNEFDK
jgi:glyoxylase-like metal-dependent hydrolase (beta-lactamase superfamily II)